MNQWGIKSMWQSFRRVMNKKHTISFSPRIPEVFAGAFIILSTIITYLYGMILVLPDLLVEQPIVLLLFMRILGTWIVIAILSNMYLTRKRTSSIRTRMLTQPVVQPIFSKNQGSSDNEVHEITKHMGEHFTATPFGNPQNWHLCAVCEVFVPPRTWHCNLCNTCILRRDHHCIFTGCCIGEENQSNFMGLVFYLAIGTTLATMFSLAYHMYILDQSFLSFVFRSVVVIYTLIYDFDVKYIIAAISSVGHLLSWGVFGYYFYNTLKGQTSADAHRKRYWTAPGCGRISFTNMRNFLGPHPILRILWPFHSPLKINYDLTQAGCKPGDEDRKGL